MVVRVVLLALACAVVVHLFCFVLHSAAHGLPKLLPNPWVRAFLGGCVVVVFTLLYGSMRYNGAGVNIIAAAVEQGQALPWDWIVKILLTALTLSSGFKGGEVVPSFFCGGNLWLCGRAAAGHPGGLWRSPWVGWRILRCQQLRGGITGAGNRAVRCAGALVLCHRVRHYLCAFRLCRALPQPAVPNG